MHGTQVLNLAWSVFSHAAAHPARPAVVVDGQTYAYATLAAEAARVAQWLHARTGEAHQAPRVGILAARSFETYAGILGVAWAGGTYVPLNPKQPASRIASVTERADVVALIVDKRGAERLRELGDAAPPHVLMTEAAHAELAHPGATAWKDLPPATRPLAPPAAVAADQPAYIIFTSGTTGVPKGVMVGAGAVATYVANLRSMYGLKADDRFAQFIELTFDPSVMELFCCWDAGASLHVIPETKQMAPGGFLREHRITFLAAVPSLITMMSRMKQLAPGALESLRVTSFGGEGLSIELARAWKTAAPNSAVDNYYGPTEATVACLFQPLTDEPAVTPGRGTMAIGRPFPGTSAEVIDANLNFLPPGSTGELVVAGPQLAIGYCGDDRQTAAKFPMLDHPHLGRSRWYLTGDLALHDGNCVFHCLGRVDHQVKVMGHRVELEEIEAHLRAVCSTDEVAAVAWPVVNGSASGIVGFVCGGRLAAGAIRDELRRRVPAYMVPNKVLSMDALPLSVNGKVDRHRLKSMLEAEKEPKVRL